MTVTEAEELLPSGKFVRVHRSFIAAIDAVQRIERHQLTLADGTIIPVGGSYMKNLEL